MRHLLASTLGCALWCAAQAEVYGPVYPPPGGVAFYGTGSAAHAGGRLHTYADLQVSALSRLAWGPWSDDAVYCSFARSSTEPYQWQDRMYPDWSFSDIAGGVAAWSGTTSAVTPNGTIVVPTLFLLRVEHDPGEPVALLSGAEWGAATAWLARVPSDGRFRATFQFLAFSGSWQPLASVFDSLHVMPWYACRSDFSGGFFYNPRVPLHGAVELRDFGGNPMGMTVSLHVRRPGSTANIEGAPVVLDASGEFDVDLMHLGPVEIDAKANHWLCQRRPLDLAEGGNSIAFSLPNGDVEGSNRVDLDDFLILAANYERLPLANPESDLNGDETCDLEDFLILAANYEMAGD